jgi:hypothetical protein
VLYTGFDSEPKLPIVIGDPVGALPVEPPLLPPVDAVAGVDPELVPAEVLLPLLLQAVRVMARAALAAIAAVSFLLGTVTPLTRLDAA